MADRPPSGPYPGDTERQVDYEARQRRAGLPYLTRCPSCDDRCRVTGGKRRLMVWWRREPHDDQADSDGYVREVCSFCKLHEDKTRYADKNRRDHARAIREDEWEARLASPPPEVQGRARAADDGPGGWWGIQEGGG